MEGKSFYGKTTSPKVIAEASLADSFSFDLQRFDNEYTGWSIGGSDTLKDKLVYMSSNDAKASLFADNDTRWSLGGSSDSAITLNLGDRSTTGATSGSVTGADINASINQKNITKFDASDLNASFHFKLASTTTLTSILGSNQGDSIDASAVANGNLSISGGSEADTLIAGKSGTFYLDGGAGDDSLVGGNGKDYFIYDGTGSDSISGYGSGDVISLSAFPGVASVGTDSSNHLVLNFGNNNSLTFADNNSEGSIFTITNGSDTYYYNKNFIRTGNQFSLTGAAPSLDASSFTSAVTIDGSAADATNGLQIIGTSRDDSIIGSNNTASTIFGGGGDDIVSLKSDTENVDIFVYNGKGKASIEGLGANGYVSLSATKAALITDGNSLESLAGSTAGKSSFRLTFGTSNTLTFKDTNSASIKTDTDTLVYTPTAISIAGAGDVGDSVTLGADYKDQTFGTADDSKFTWIDASAVASNMSAFAIAGSTSGGNRLIGSDYIVTSILGGTGADALYAGKAGASLVGNGGNDSLFGDTAKAAKDYFFYNAGKALITNYTNSGDNEDVVSLTGSETTAPTNTSKFSLDSGTNTFNISLGASGDENVLSFASSRQVNIHAVGTSSINTLFHYEADKVIVDNNRVTLGSNFKGSNYKVSSLGETYENMASIDASAVTTSGGLNITGNESATNSIIGAQSGGKITGGTGSDYLKSGVVADNSTVTTTIDAGIDPDSGTTDTLVGGNGYDWFIYRGAKASIGSYTSGKDTIQILGEGLNMMSEDEPPVFATVTAADGGGGSEPSGGGGGEQVPEPQSDPEEKGSAAGDLVLALGTNRLTVAGGAASGFITTFRYGQNTFNYNSGAVSLNNKSVTLTSDYQVGNTAYAATGSISAVNASAVTISGTNNFVSLQANANLDTRLTGSSIAANALISDAKNDYLTGGDAADIFVYTSGKDTVANYQLTDSLSADNFVDKIATGKVSGTKLIFTGTEKGKVLTFLSDDDAIEKVSLSGGGYLTKDGYVKETTEGGTKTGTLKLFSSAKDEIDLTDTNLYKLGENGSTSNITSVNAADVKQSIILTTDSLSSDATYILPDNNKKRDRFMYAGGKVSISGYEGGKDQINLGDGSIQGFAISDKVLQISVSSSGNDIISIAGGNSADLLIHQSTDANNIYRKMALTQDGILTNRASKPTTATVLGGAASLNATDLSSGTIKKIFAANDAVTKVSIEAGNKNNTTINMSAAGSGVSIYGGKKNDKITGSNTEGDLFVYRTDSGGTGGKDVITNYTSGSDVVSIGAEALASLSGAKITARDKSVMIKFSGNKNSLNLKNSDSNITAVTIRDNSTDGTPYTFGKSSFSTTSGSVVSLTSAFSGSFDLSKVKLGDNSATAVDGHLVGKNLTYKGTAASEKLSGGSRKTTFKGGGGTDELTGGSGKDIFTYAKGNAGTTTIKDFDYTKDQIKIAGGTLDKIETISGGVRFAMKNNGSNIGWYDITSAAAYKKDGTKDTETDLGAPNSTNTVFKANNTYFWFAQDTVTDEVTVKGSEDKETVTLASAGDLITYNTRVSASDVGNLNVIDLNYSTNLVKSGVAVAVSKTASGADIPTK